MPIRITGINSGFDTDAMVKELVKSYSSKTDDIKKEQTKAEWKQDAWTELNKKIKSFSSKYVSNMQYSNYYSKKKTNVSDDSKVSVVTGDNAVSGTQTIEVKSLAKSAYITGGQLSSTSGSVSGDSTLSDLGYSGGATQLTLTKGSGDPITIDVDEDTKISTITDALSAAGLNANLDEKTGRLFVSSKASGAENNFEITADTAVGKEALGFLGLSEEDFSYTRGASIGEGTHDGSTLLSELGAQPGQISIKTGDDNTTVIDISEDETIDSFLEKINSVEGVNATFNEEKGVLTFSGTITAVDEGGSQTLSALGLDPSGGSATTIAGKATKIDGQDAEIILNGASFKSNNNAFSVNGLTITAKDVTDAEVTLSTDSDYDSIYDSIKSFIKDYSELINELDKVYNADRAKGFEPLTAEEKEALTEEEVEKWETKIKDSLLRRDSDVASVASAMKNAMASTYEVDGKKLSLSSFGINTLSYFLSAENEKNAYHIDGDPDDDATSGNTDKLKAAIASNPEQVSSFFQKLSSNMYESFQNMTRSSSSRSYGSFYDDKKVKKDYESYETKLSEWESYVAEMEDKYYAQFSAMEKAMSKLNSQQTYISNMFGG